MITPKIARLWGLVCKTCFWHFTSLDLGAVWIGEILKNKERVREILQLPARLELMAVVAVGHPAHRNQKSHRRPLEELILLEK